ncbi:hypothetical protein B0T09DRAFT_263016, partial [Sordaria sp. MPI-SDFR-AT-0083]
TKQGLKAFRPNTHHYYNVHHISHDANSSPAMHGFWKMEQTNISWLLHPQLPPTTNGRAAKASLIYSTPLASIRHCISDGWNSCILFASCLFDNYPVLLSSWATIGGGKSCLLPMAPLIL